MLEKRQELTVIPADDHGRCIGFTIRETIGVAVVNDWAWLPWYKKIFRKRFYVDLLYPNRWGTLFHRIRIKCYSDDPERNIG